jgi:hypothetical protein
MLFDKITLKYLTLKFSLAYSLPVSFGLFGWRSIALQDLNQQQDPF